MLMHTVVRSPPTLIAYNLLVTVSSLTSASQTVRLFRSQAPYKA